MARKAAPAKATAGGGFVFENDVCALFLAHMLQDSPPLGEDFGRLVQMEFQTRDLGWGKLDDVLLTLASETGTCRAALSIKSNSQFTAFRAPQDFVRAAWVHYLKSSPTPFSPEHDVLGLVTSPLPPKVRGAIDILATSAKPGSPIRLATRIASMSPQGAQRGLFESFCCPNDLASGKEVEELNPAHLLARLVFRQYDFDSPQSNDRAYALGICRHVLRKGGTREARKLWDRLTSLANELRPAYGLLTRDTLIQRLRGSFNLADHPDHRDDWARLKKRTELILVGIRDEIGTHIRLPRYEQLKKLQQMAAAANFIGLLGPSGAGKSAVAKQWAVDTMSKGEKCLWVEARSLRRADVSEFENSLHLAHPLHELADSIPDPFGLVVVDGADQLFAADAFALLAQLLSIINLTTAQSPWRLVVTSQSDEWPRLKRAMEDAGIHVAGCIEVECEPPSDADLEPVWQTYPSVSRLRFHRQLQPLLKNLKILDLIVHRLTESEESNAAGWVGESSVAEWFWKKYLLEAENGLARAKLMTALAEEMADRSHSSIPLLSLSLDFERLQDLRRDHLCRVTDDEQIEFVHTLYGDWARLRRIVSESGDLGDLRRFLQPHLSKPLWLRAIRLYGNHLLETGSDQTAWRKALDAFADTDTVRDLWLDSIVYSANPLHLLNREKDKLIQQDARLLIILLKRFLTLATVPDPRAVVAAAAMGTPEVLADSQFRYPNWVYWLGVIQFLHANRNTLVTLAPSEVGQVVEMWLKRVPAGWALRREAAELGLMLGRWMLESERADRWATLPPKMLVFRVGLLGAQELPSEVADFALDCCYRKAPENSRGPPRQPEIDQVPRREQLPWNRFYDDAPFSDPWPDGPRRRIDNDFCNVALESETLLPLFAANPAVAREVILAVLIASPEQQVHDSRLLGMRGLNDDVHLYPPSYWAGPFLSLLNSNFDEALPLILKLVDFATARSIEDDSRSDGGDPPPKSRSVIIRIDDAAHEFVGGSPVYAWSRGHALVPDPVFAALTALEQHFYTRSDQKKPIEAELARVLGQARSVAFLAVLVSIGKRQPAFFLQSLAPLVTAPELYCWDAELAMNEQGHNLIAFSSSTAVLTEKARNFHEMPHRKLLLRFVISWLFANDPQFQVLFDSARTRWQVQLAEEQENGMVTILEYLLVAFYPPNWEEVTGENGKKYWVNDPLQRIEDAGAPDRARAQEDLQLLMLPPRCRERIDNKTPLRPDELGPFWDSIKRVHAMTQERVDEIGLPDLRTNVVTGGIAVLLSLHKSWLEADAARISWCANVLLEAISKQLALPDEMIRGEGNELTWSAFAAESLSILWSSQRENKIYRRAIARFVLQPRSYPVSVLFKRCAVLKGEFGEDFGRLQRIAFAWAFMLPRVAFVNWAKQVSLERISSTRMARYECQLARWTDKLVDDFVDGVLPIASSVWDEMDSSKAFRALERVRRNWRNYEIDWALIRASHDWLPTLDCSVDGERLQIIAFWREAMKRAGPGADKPDGSRIVVYHHPDQYQAWVLEGVAVTVLHMNLEEDPRSLWQPILDYPPHGMHWREAFLQQLNQHGLQDPSSHAKYLRIVSSMVDHAVNKIQETTSWRYYDPSWCALIGIDPSTARWSWKPEHQALVRCTRNVFASWAERIPIDDSTIGNLSVWLHCAAAEPVRLSGLSWLVRMIQRLHYGDIYHRHAVADAIADLLAVVWEKHKNELRDNPDADRAYKRLLDDLVNHQHPIAMDLQAKAAGLT